MCSYFLLSEVFQGNEADDIDSGVYGNFTAETARDSVQPRTNIGATGSWDDRRVQLLVLHAALLC